MNFASRNTDAITGRNTDGDIRRPGQWSRGVYLITPDDSETDRLLARVDAVLEHAALLQYRNKSASPALRRTQAEALRARCAKYRVPLIVNDDLALANAVGADGVHLGEEDGDTEVARAAASAASYIAFGAFFPSTTKPNARRASVDLLRDSAGFGLPRVAIGGITPDNARSVVAAGADLIAVISGVFDASDPVAAMQAYRACFD
jgi:thiamine-phosphate pyrophosphorylase